MKIAIDLNDVIRAFTKNFAKVYQKEYNREFDSETLEITTNDMSKLFPFDSQAEYKRFVYEDYAYELFGKCDTVSKYTQAYFNRWLEELKNIDCEEDINVVVVSPMEYGLTIQSTYFFLSKIGCRVREVYLPTDSLTIWDKCDILITANPKLLENKPDDKISIKIETDYNIECSANETYAEISDYFNDIENVIKYLKNKN